MPRPRLALPVALLMACAGDDTATSATSATTATSATSATTATATTGADSSTSDDPSAPGSSTSAGSASGDPTATTSDPTTGDPTTGDPTTGDPTGDPTGGDPSAPCGHPDADPALYCPGPGASWQWQLSGDIDTAVDAAMFDIDLFDAPDAALQQLHGQGRVVVCYFSAGSHEDWRPDADQFPPAALGDPLDGWPGERWLDHRDPAVRQILAARLDLAAARGCDGVEPDNVDGYANATGFPLTAADQLDFNLWLAAEAHARGLSVGLKNDLDQVPDLVDHFDWALDEECVAYDECDLLAPFIDGGKAVFHVEYVDDPADGPALAAAVCPATKGLGFSTLIKEWDLGPWRIVCP